jgi:hypothetical protein
MLWMATSDCKRLGRRIRALRAERGWTQQPLADHAATCSAPLPNQLAHFTDEKAAGRIGRIALSNIQGEKCSFSGAVKCLIGPSSIDPQLRRACGTRPDRYADPLPVGNQGQVGACMVRGTDAQDKT